MLEEAYGKAAMKKTQFTSGIIVFVMAVRVSMTIRAVSNRPLLQTMKASRVCAMLCEVIDERAFRGYQQNKVH
jgi:hypothetical protein